VSVRRVAIVTGAASGIGRATADRLVTDGWSVVGIDLKPADGAAFSCLAGDATRPDVLAEAMEAAGEQLHGLVCAAGIPPTSTWDDRDAWDEVLGVDLSGPYEVLRVALPALGRGRGSAVLVGSIVGSVEGSARSPAYAAAKSGLSGLVRSMALVGAESGVRVNLVEPGAIDTPFDAPRYPPDARPDVPLGRMGTAIEVAGAIVFLLGADATYITGATLRVDGGRTIRSPSAEA
jgi:NAD(P)-dependent dehydrogenase (short-subunit alcohol dehydrogenase family)